MGVSEPTILQMLANQCTREVNIKNNTAILMKESIVEPFEYVLIVLIHGDVVWPNKAVHQGKMGKLIIDR